MPGINNPASIALTLRKGVSDHFYVRAGFQCFLGRGCGSAVRPTIGTVFFFPDAIDGCRLSETGLTLQETPRNFDLSATLVL